MEHSPTPWKISSDDMGYAVKGDPDALPIISMDDMVVAMVIGDLGEESKSNADFIVTCVNNHQRLVDALDNLIWDRSDPLPTPAERALAWKQAREALAALKETV